MNPSPLPLCHRCGEPIYDYTNWTTVETGPRLRAPIHQTCPAPTGEE